jgi:hypothetical protein
MSQSAALARPSLQPSDAIATYLAAALRRLDQTIASTSFPEPKGQLARGARLLGPLTETLAGLAMGTVVSAVSAIVRQSFGAEMTARVATALAKQVALYEPRKPSPLAILEDEPAHTFGAELARRLRMRIASDAGDTRRLLLIVADILASGESFEAHAFERMLAKANADSLGNEKFSRDLARGWAAWCAAVTNTQAVGQTALWTLWTKRVNNEQEVLTPSTAEVAAAGFIARIG